MRRVCTLATATLILAAAARLPAQEQIPKPGPEHEHFKQLEGVWDATIHMKEGESKGVMTWKVGLGGLWLLDHFKGDAGGMSFEGMGATSYDPAKKKYIGVWIDSMSTAPMISEGTLDKSKKIMTMVGEAPMPGGKTMKMTMISEMKDANNVVFVMKGNEGGTEFEMMKITYKRRAKSE